MRARREKRQRRRGRPSRRRGTRFLVLIAFANVAAFAFTMPAASDPASNNVHARSAAVQCIDGIDNDGDGWVDLDVLRGGGSRPGAPTYYGPDPQCMSQSDNNESPWDPPPAPPPPPPIPPPPAPPAQCIDGIDNDGDGWVDLDVLRGSGSRPGTPTYYGPDPQCLSQSDNSESPWDPPPAPPPPPPPPAPPAQCIDGIDNDGDGWIDLDVLRGSGSRPGAPTYYGPDPQCMSQSDNNESPWDPPPAPPPPPIVWESGGPTEAQADETTWEAIEQGVDDPDVVSKEPLKTPLRPFLLYRCYDTGYRAWHEWSYWPYQNRVTERTQWCVDIQRDVQIWRVSRVRLGASWCDPSGAWGDKLAGGNGYSMTLLRTGGRFSCFPIGGYDRWQDWMHLSDGRSLLYRYS
jgi:hypothetical protein